MTSDFTTIFLFSVIIILFALFAMSIGWFISKKPLKHRCGSRPGELKNEDCGSNSSCELCDTTTSKQNKKK